MEKRLVAEAKARKKQEEERIRLLKEKIQKNGGKFDTDGFKCNYYYRDADCYYEDINSITCFFQTIPQS